MHTIELKLSARYCCINGAKLLICNAFALDQKLFCWTPLDSVGMHLMIMCVCVRCVCVCIFFSFIISMMWNAKENLWFTHYTIWLMECTETMHRTQNVSQMLWEQCLNTLSFIIFKHIYIYLYIHKCIPAQHNNNDISVIFLHKTLSNVKPSTTSKLQK